MCSTPWASAPPARRLPDLQLPPRAADDVQVGNPGSARGPEVVAAMSTDTLTRFFAILSLITWAAVVVVIVLAVVHRTRPDSSLGYFFEDIREYAIWLAFPVALFTTLGSLYLSEIARLTPCPLCWYQRICMYPLFLALLIAGLRRDREIYWYVL